MNGYQKLEELHRSGVVQSSLVIVKLSGDGAWHVVGQNMAFGDLTTASHVLTEALPRIKRDMASPPAPAVTLNTLAAAWASMEQAALSSSCHPIQRRDMRRAFYTGARSFFNAMLGAVGAGEGTTASELGSLDGLHAELDRFCDEMLAGRA